MDVQKVIRIKNKKLFLEGFSLEKIAEQLGTPTYVYSEKSLLSSAAALKNGLRGLPHLICFAVKANSNLHVLKLLHQAGLGFDLVSGGELFRVQQAGAQAEKMVFSGVGKTESEILEALKFGRKGILSFNVESAAELELIHRIAKKLRRKARVLLRFNPNINPKTHPYISTGLHENKFGIHEREILALAEKYREVSWIDFCGISIHIGSQILTLDPLRESFEKTAALILKLNQLLPRKLTHVDLGGGLGVRYHEESPPSIAGYCRMIHRTFGRQSPLSGIKILLEPGRLISGSAGLLLSRVLFRKATGRKEFLIIDAAMNDLVRPALYESHHEIIPVRKPRSGKSRKMDVVGPICESSDTFAHDRKLSDEIRGGDLIAILTTGAYGFSMSSNYNSRPRAAEVLVRGKKFQIIRRRETFRDLIAHELKGKGRT